MRGPFARPHGNRLFYSLPGEKKKSWLLNFTLVFCSRIYLNQAEDETRSQEFHYDTGWHFQLRNYSFLIQFSHLWLGGHPWSHTDTNILSCPNCRYEGLGGGGLSTRFIDKRKQANSNECQAIRHNDVKLLLACNTECSKYWTGTQRWLLTIKHTILSLTNIYFYSDL